MTPVSQWTPPSIADLRFIERDGRWLVLNPAVPGWLATTHAGSLLVRLADGRRSVGEIGHLLDSSGIAVEPRFVEEFFAEARRSRLFDPAPPPRDIGRFWRERKLSAMHLHLTDRCNLHCSYCLRESSPQVPIRHDPDRFCAMLQFIKPFTADRLEVTFTGGEPLMYPGFAEVVEESSRCGYHNLLFTNGILVTEPKAEFIAAHFDRVQISLDGADRRSHAQTRGDNFRQVIRGIDRLHHAGIAVTVQVTLSSTNLDSARRIRDVLPENVNLRFTPAMPHGRGVDVADTFISEDEFIDFTQSASDPTNTRYTPGTQIRSCSAGMNNLSIADTGDVYPCHLFHRDEFRFGNLFHDEFADIFFGDPIRAYVQSMDVSANNSVCAHCEVRFLCGGGCKANAMAATGDYHGVDMWCGYLKETIYANLLGLHSAHTPGHRDGDPAAPGDSGHRSLIGRPLPLSPTATRGITMDTTT